MYSVLFRHYPLRLSSAVIWGGQYAVVVVVVLGPVGDDVDGGEPFYHLSLGLSGDDDMGRESVIGLENLALGLVGDEDFIGCMHVPCKGVGHAVLDELASGFFLEVFGPNLVGGVLHTDELDAISGHALSDTPELSSR